MKSEEVLVERRVGPSVAPVVVDGAAHSPPAPIGVEAPEGERNPPRLLRRGYPKATARAARRPAELGYPDGTATIAMSIHEAPHAAREARHAVGPRDERVDRQRVERGLGA